MGDFMFGSGPGHPFDQAVAKAVLSDIAAAAGIVQ